MKTYTNIFSKIRMLLFAVTVLILLTGCSGHARRNVKIDSSYPEWIEAMKPEISSNRIYAYEEKDNSITLIINNPSFEDYLTILDRHTTFVEENPDYFPKDINIFFATNEGGMCPCDWFRNRMDGPEEVISDDEDAYLRYAQFESYAANVYLRNVENIDTRKCFSQIEFLYFYEGNEANYENYRPEWFKQFPKLQAIGLGGLYQDPVTSETEAMLKEFHESYPKLTVFSGAYSSSENCYKEYKDLFGGTDKDSTIQCNVSLEEEFGSTQFVIEPAEFENVGFEFGDALTLEFSNGKRFENIPFFSGYYGKTGEMAVVEYPGYEYTVFARCQGNSTWEENDFEDGDSVTVSLYQKGLYKGIQDALSMTYTDNREDYSGDDIFANFRNIEVGRIKKNMFFRGASPADNQHNRAQYADALIEEAGIGFILDLADTEEKIKGYMEKDDFASPYFAQLYNSGYVYAAGMSASYSSEDFAQKVVALFKAATLNEGPYYIHCTEGKDRTGFVCILLESLADASYEELESDYMKTYENYYGISPQNDADRYAGIVECKFEDMVFYLAGVDSREEITAEKIKEGVHKYLIDAGMTEEEYIALVAILCE